MPKNAGFHVYTLRIRERYEKEAETLSAIQDDTDLLPTLFAGLKSEVEAHKNDPAAERMACVKQVSKRERSLTGIFTAGNYGEATDIVDSIRASVSYEKKTTDAEMLPCFFRLEIPEDKDEALLILQRDNRVSSKAAFSSLLNSVVMQIDPELRVHITPLVNREEFEKLVGEGQVQTLRFIKMELTSDLADSYDEGHKEVEGSVEYVVRARKGRSLPFRNLLRGWSRTNSSVRDVFELPALDFDTVKAEVKVGRKTQTVDFGKRLNTPILDLTSSVQFGPDGHPTYSTLVDATAELAEGYIEMMYG